METPRIIAPVVCFCSGKQTHSREHLECKCNGMYRFRQGMQAPFVYIPLPALVDADGYDLCRYCGKVRHPDNETLKKFALTQLTQCPDCGRWFKGFKRYIKFDYECEKCG